MGCSNHPDSKDIAQITASAKASPFTWNPTPSTHVDIYKWHRSPSDSRYEEKFAEFGKGKGFYRMSRPIGLPTDPRDPDYPHDNQVYIYDVDEKGVTHKDSIHRENFTLPDKKIDKPKDEITPEDKKTPWDAHYSWLDEKGKPDHFGEHKTLQATLDDLDMAINSLK